MSGCKGPPSSLGSEPIRAGAIEHCVEIHVFGLNETPDIVKALRGLLSQDELARAERFASPAFANRFIVARGRLRQILARSLATGPHQIEFTLTPTGKPLLQQPNQPATHFNLSHSGERAAVAVCRTAQVGIDIERVRDVRDGLARRFFAADEVAKLEALQGDERREAFFRCWTRKEAFLKATGEGIRRGLDSFSVSVAADEKPRIVSIDGNLDAARHWQLRDLQPGPGYRGALVIDAQISENVELQHHST